MQLFWKAAAAALIASVLGLSLGKDMSLLLSLTVCAMGIAAALEFMEPVLDLLRQMEAAADIPGDILKILFKAVGIGLTAEIAGMICKDAGSGAIANMLRIFACIVILWLSIPLLQSILTLLQQILGGV